MPLPALVRPTLPPPARIGLAAAGAALILVSLGTPVALVVAIGLAWLFWGHGIGLGALFGVALAFAAWLAPTPAASRGPVSSPVAAKPLDRAPASPTAPPTPAAAPGAPTR